jgi:uncharacterized protein (TIGR01244 family)
MLRVFLRAAGLAMLVCVSGVIGYATMIGLTGNFHAVVAGEVYRSAQPSASDVARVQKLYGIRSILNQRGGDRDDASFAAVAAEAQSLGIQQINFPMSDSRRLDTDQMNQLIALMRDAPKPLLIHCKAGADRSGLASALYLAAIAGKGEREAEDQLSIAFGHVSLPVSRSYAMDESWELMEPLLGFLDS